MVEFIFSSANLYAGTAKTYYKEYLQITDEYDSANEYMKKHPEDTEAVSRVYALAGAREVKAIAAVVFQAFAIEAYVNLFGYIVFGEEYYTKRIDRGLLERKPVEIKLDLICTELNSTYPVGHKGEIEVLFTKRDGIVHQKPKKYEIAVQPFDYAHPENNFLEMAKIEQENYFFFENLDRNMQLYEELQENIKTIRGTGCELIKEISNKQLESSLKEMDRNIAEIYQKAGF